MDGVLVSAPHTGGDGKLFSVCIYTVDLILQINKGHSK